MLDNPFSAADDCICMVRDLSQLDQYLTGESVDAYLIDASQEESDQLYLSDFTGPDPFMTLYDGQTHLLVSGLEYGRARTDSRADTVDRYADYDYEYGGHEETYDIYAEFIQSRDVDSVAVPRRAPVGTADALRERGVEVTVDESGVIGDIREVKTDAEVANVETTQQANEAAMAAAEELLSVASVEGSQLHHHGDPLTSERVKQEIETTLLEHGCALDETIVACGSQAADPHDRGSGPLTAGEPIIIDIFPRDKATKYHADMTRTFVVGEPDERLQEWHALTQKALDNALSQVEPGTSGKEVHAAACEVYENAGLPTLRAEPDTETGFIHSTGHGVGLDVHEGPSLSPRGGPLEAGHIITVEPGLYDPAVGGVRIEDIVVVTDDGFRNLTDYPIELAIE